MQMLSLAASLRIWGVRADGNLGDSSKPRSAVVWMGGCDALDLEGAVFHVYVTFAYAPPWMGPRNTPPPEAEWIRFVKTFGELQGKGPIHWDLE